MYRSRARRRSPGELPALGRGRRSHAPERRRTARAATPGVTSGINLPIFLARIASTFQAMPEMRATPCVSCEVGRRQCRNTNHRERLTPRLHHESSSGWSRFRARQRPGPAVRRGFVGPARRSPGRDNSPPVLCDRDARHDVLHPGSRAAEGSAGGSAACLRRVSWSAAGTPEHRAPGWRAGVVADEYGGSMNKRYLPPANEAHAGARAS